MIEKENISKEFLNDLKYIISESKRKVVSSINYIMLQTYWTIGKRIVEEEQKGDFKAEYGSSLLKEIAIELTSEFGRGYSRINLQYMRKFYLEYKNAEAISLRLSWSHYLLLLSISDKNERSFYEKECENSNWSVRTLERQIDSSLYLRLLLSKEEVNKKTILELAQKGITYNTPDSFIKDPMVVEFLPLQKEKIIVEANLEKALTNKIEELLLELGRGFMFVGTQQRISIGNLNYYVDMVFYNNILKAYVLIDLKTTKFKPEYIGQMNFYINYYKKEINKKGDQDPIGIILCADKNNKIVDLAVQGLENNIYATKYTTVMPDVNMLQDEVSRLVGAFANKIDDIKLTSREKKIVEMLAKNTNLTIEEIANKLKLTPRTIKTIFKKLQEQGIIKRVGSSKKGKWEVVKNNLW